MAVSSHFDEVCNVLNVCGSYRHYITSQPFSAFIDKKQHNYIPRSSNLYFCVCIIISIDRTTIQVQYLQLKEMFTYVQASLHLHLGASLNHC